MPSDGSNSLRSSNFMAYPSPSESERARILAHLSDTETVSEETKQCVANLLAYRAARTRGRLPRGASAAVLVPLFVGRSGEVYVLLSRRSDALKTFAGDTALPGGRVDDQDGTVEDAAMRLRREAFEEIGLPRDKERVPLLCVLEPHLARGEIIVTPVVVLILDHSLQPNLNASEVTSIFAQPLITFLSSSSRPPPHHLSGGRMTANPNSPYHTFTDVSWGDGVVRLHRFLTGREGEGVKPVFGLTASILIKTATIGYGRLPDFEVQPSNAPTPWQQVARALLTPGNPLRVACELEGIDANEAAARLLRPPLAAANAVRTVDWERVGAVWKWLLKGGGLADDTRDSRPGAARHPGNRRRAPDRAGETKERVVERAQGAADGPGAIIEGHKKHAHGKRKWQAATTGIDKLGASLDETRDRVKEQVRELENDEHVEGLCGTFDTMGLVSLFPKEGLEGLKHSVEAGKEGVVKAKGEDDDSKRRERDMEKGGEGMRRGLEGMNDYAGEGRDDDPKQAILLKKHNAKL